MHKYTIFLEENLSEDEVQRVYTLWEISAGNLSVLLFLGS